MPNIITPTLRFANVRNGQLHIYCPIDMNFTYAEHLAFASNVESLDETDTTIITTYPTIAIQVSDLPTRRDFRDAWEIDMATGHITINIPRAKVRAIEVARATGHTELLADIESASTLEQLYALMDTIDLYGQNARPRTSK